MDLIQIFSSTKTINICHNCPKKQGRFTFVSKAPLYQDDTRVKNKKRIHYIYCMQRQSIVYNNLFAQIANGFLSFTVFAKSLHQRCLTGF